MANRAEVPLGAVVVAELERITNPLKGHFAKTVGNVCLRAEDVAQPWTRLARLIENTMGTSA